MKFSAVSVLVNSMKNPIKFLSKTESIILSTSIVVICLSYILSGAGDALTVISSVIGVIAVMFVAKGYVFGQMLCIVFAIIYGIISFNYRYYGEMITYLCMSMPVAFAALISWIRHPFKNSLEVEVANLTSRKITVLSVLTVVVTVAFYFILKALGTANLVVSTFSVATSFSASCLSILRSPYYAVVYGLNDIILIILWIMASVEQISYLPMVFCFVMFLVNDIYGFYNWCKMREKQNKITETV